MEREDYIKKQIDQLGFVIQQLLNLWIGHNPASNNEIDKIEKDLKTSGINISKMGLMNKEELEKYFSDKKEISIENIELLGEIFVQKGKQLNNKSMLRQALNIYEYVVKNSNTFNFNWTNKISELKKLIK